MTSETLRAALAIGFKKRRIRSEPREQPVEPPTVEPVQEAAEEQKVE